MRDTFLIVDGNSLLYRAFHALPLMDYNGLYKRLGKRDSL